MRLLRGTSGAALLLFALLAVLYTASIGLRASRSASITGDEPFYLVTTQSLIDDGDLDLRNQHATESYRSFFDHPDGLWRQADPLENGQLLSPHHPGLSVLLIPGFAAGGLLGAQLQMLLIAAATFSLAFVFIAGETGRQWLSWGVTAVVALSPPAFVYATEIYPEMAAALCLIGALLLARRASSGGATRRGESKLGETLQDTSRLGETPQDESKLGKTLQDESCSFCNAVLLLGVLTVLAWLGLKYIPLGLLVAAYYLWRASARERLWFVGLGGISAVVYVAWHYATFGALTPYQTNLVYEGTSTQAVFSSHVTFDDRVYRLWGLFVDRRFGIGRWAPVFLAVWPLLPLAWRATRTGPVVVGVIVTQILVATFASVTMMGWWFPGRMLIVVMPLMALVLTAGLIRLPRPGQAIAAVAAAYSLLVTALLVQAGHSGEVVMAVDPFAMTAWPFTAIAGAFPQYTWWSDETILLNALWFSGGLIATLTVAWLTFRPRWPGRRRQSNQMMTSR